MKNANRKKFSKEKLANCNLELINGLNCLLDAYEKLGQASHAILCSEISESASMKAQNLKFKIYEIQTIVSKKIHKEDHSLWEELQQKGLLG